jgi:hypothetical protein
MKCFQGSRILQTQRALLRLNCSCFSHYICENTWYCNVLGGSIHDGSLFQLQKLSILQFNAISHSPNTHQASTLSDVPHKTPSTGTLPVISQHELTFLQSVNLQTQVRAQPLRSLGTNSHSCNQEAYKHTCFSRSFPILTQSSNTRASLAVSQY